MARKVLNPGPLTYESGALPTALRVPALSKVKESWYLKYIGVFMICLSSDERQRRIDIHAMSYDVACTLMRRCIKS